MPKLIPGRLPDPPVKYDQRQFNQILRQIQLALGIDVETKRSADDREAIDFFLSK